MDTRRHSSFLFQLKNILATVIEDIDHQQAALINTLSLLNQNYIYKQLETIQENYTSTIEKYRDHIVTLVSSALANMIIMELELNLTRDVLQPYFHDNTIVSLHDLKVSPAFKIC